MLRNGVPAPDFTLNNYDGTSWKLKSALGKPLALIFFRGRFCPTSDRFLAAYQDIIPRLKELKISLVAISCDPKEEHRYLRDALRLSFPLLSDPNFSVCGAYGLYRVERGNGGSFCEPGVVVIDKDGRVAYSVISSGPKGLPSPGDLLPVLLYMFTHEGRY